jgi:hypothetical protein
MKHTAFHHEVFFYGDGDEFLAGTVPYLREAIEAGGPALVAVGPERAGELRGELGPDVSAVRFVDMQAIGRNPARIIPFWRDFVDQQGGSDRPIRGIGEPVWPGRNAHELDECRRHERLLNFTFEGGRAWSLLCPYDTRRLADEELEAAAGCHPFASGTAVPEAGGASSGATDTIFAGALPPRPPDAGELRFDLHGLAGARGIVLCRRR